MIDSIFRFLGVEFNFRVPAKYLWLGETLITLYANDLAIRRHKKGMTAWWIAVTWGRGK